MEVITHLGLDERLAKAEEAEQCVGKLLALGEFNCLKEGPRKISLMFNSVNQGRQKGGKSRI